MNLLLTRVTDIIIVVLALICFKECFTNDFKTIDNKYHLVTESYNVAREIFVRGRISYEKLKNTSLHVMDTFLDLVRIMNEEMAKELRSAVIKFYKIKYFHDFTNYVISLEEMTDIIEHCLTDPVEKIDSIKEQFHAVINNFEDIRHFETVDKCMDQLPDEVAVAHCILHQAVLFNETMQGSLVSIVEIKTNQYARRMNASIYSVQRCLNNLVPYFFEQLLVDSYTDKCSFLDMIKNSIEDLIKDEWRNIKNALFPKKWGTVIGYLKEQSTSPQKYVQQSLLMTLISSNSTLSDVKKTFYT
ncbi:unnamed protein product [Euphydryas editha]|uniref:Uncharacterized protein n=1 Tax=Euphydryas editha TaxID=104508 RepID=A0AAU9UEX1_EUPED|nr:unnamed protein product [Euphydryas editha]